MSSALHPRAKELFLAARQRPLDERRAFVAERCAGDEPLRREVESLLDFLDEEPDAAAAARPRPGRITDYRLLRRLGEGGMGVVWEAEQERPLRRRVALKILRSGLGEEVLGRFEAERQALARMEHPNIATVFDAGTSEDGRPFFVMEYVDGAPITDYCDAHRLPLRKRLELFAVICRGVEHAHQRGVIHRDLKPSNLLVGQVDGRPMPKIIDFGVAKAVTGPAAAPLVTAPGGWIGTPEYMSPEQARPGSEPVDGRSDVYALGLILYELLVGMRPHQDEEPGSAAEIRSRLDGRPPPPPSDRAAGSGEALAAVAARRGTEGPELVRQLRGGLDQIALAAVAPERRRRYGSPGELGLAIEGLLRVGLGGPGAGATRRAGGGASRRRAAAVVLLLAVAAVAAGVVLWRARAPAARPVAGSTAPRSQRPSLAVLPFDNLGGAAADEYFSDGLSEELINALAQLEGLQVAARTSSFEFKDRREDVRRIAERLGVGIVLEGSVRRSGDRLRITAQLIEAASGFHLWSAVFDREAGELFAIQDEIAREVARALEVELLDGAGGAGRAGRTIDAWEHYLRGRQALRGQSPEALGEAVDELSAAIELDPGNAAAHSGLAEAWIELARRGDLAMEEAERRAGAALRRALELDGELAEAHATLGLLRFTIGATPEAEASLRRALELNPSLASAHLLLGRLLSSRNRGGEAEAAYAQAVRLDPLNRMAHHAVARSRMDSGRYEEALALFEQWLRIEPESAETFRVMALYARAYGELDRALVWARRAVELDPQSPLNLHELVMAYSRLGETRLAGEWMDRAYSMAPNNHWTQALRAFTFIEQGDLEGLDRFADSLLELVRRDADSAVRSQASRLRLALAGMAKVYRGDHAAGAALYERALGTPFVGVLEPGIDADALALQAHAYDRLGRAELAAAAIERCREVIGSRRDWIWSHLIMPDKIAALEVLRGREDQAVAILSRAVEDGWAHPSALRRAPYFEPLRRRADFQQLIGRLSARVEEQRRRLPPGPELPAPESAATQPPTAAKPAARAE